MKYNLLPNGTTILSPINAGISQYNAYTKACAPGGAQYGKKQFGQPLCGYTTDGQARSARATRRAAQPDPSCKHPHDVANPYWLSPAFSLLRSERGVSALLDVFPGPVGSGVNAYNFPYVATLLLNYKHDRFTVTPSFQFVRATATARR